MFASIEEAWGVDSFRAPRRRRQPGSRPTSAAAALSAAGLAGGACGAIPGTEAYEPYNDRYMYVPRHPRGREAGGERNIVMAEGAGSYDAAPALYGGAVPSAAPPVYGTAAAPGLYGGVAPSAAPYARQVTSPAALGGGDLAMLPSAGSFMEYDDFYSQDHQYSSPVGTAVSDVGSSSHAPFLPMGSGGNVSAEQQRPRQEQPTREEATPASALPPPVQRFEQYENYDRNTGSKDQRAVYDLVLYTLSGVFLILVMEQFIQLGRMMR